MEKTTRRQRRKIAEIVDRHLPETISSKIQSLIKVSLEKREIHLILMYLRCKLAYHNALGIIDIHYECLINDLITLLYITKHGEIEVSYFTYIESSYTKHFDHFGKQYIKFQNDLDSYQNQHYFSSSKS